VIYDDNLPGKKLQIMIDCGLNQKMEFARLKHFFKKMDKVANNLGNIILDAFSSSFWAWFRVLWWLAYRDEFYRPLGIRQNYGSITSSRLRIKELHGLIYKFAAGIHAKS
jgi:hypothetical protein